MNIEIPDHQYQQLSVKAKAAGFADVSAFIGALAGEPATDPRGPLIEDERRESIAMIERGNAEIEQGRGMDAQEAFRRIASKHGFSLDR